ncbi:MAG: glycoside hydrolase family 2 protein [Planctomycetota bacterium]
MAIPRTLTIDRGWQVCHQPITRRARDLGAVPARRGWIPAAVPGDVRLDLLRAGRIKEPAAGLNYMDQLWIEDRSWWYRVSFTAPCALAAAERLDLVCDGLDVRADIFLDGIHLGRHPSAFRPFTADVTGLIRPGRINRLMVRLTTGNRDVTPAEKKLAHAISTRNQHPGGRYEETMVVLRKPAFTWGWDWTTRIPTCGIAGPVRIIPRRRAFIRDAHVATLEAAAERAVLDVTVELENCSHTADRAVTLETALTDGRSRLYQRIEVMHLIAGRNLSRQRVELPHPRLWWPNGHGAQPLYRLDVTLREGSRVCDRHAVPFGIRTVRLREDRLNDRERTFGIEVNGRVIFCKGGNWVPADPLPARITPARYERLIREAAGAHFNMLRVWGGGLYEPDIFYELCDRHGIMLWHDFMFACSPYPEDDDFKAEITREAEHQLLRLRNHPAVVLWCGNNENNQGADGWFARFGFDLRRPWGGVLYGDVLPAAVARLAPHTPYWTSSPFGGPTPNSPLAGDRHCWDWAMHADPTMRVTPEKFDAETAKFMSEYGHIGPPVKATLLAGLGGDRRAYADRTSPAFLAHVNRFGHGTTEAGIRAFYRDPEGLSTDAFLFYGGLAQGVMYGYTLEALRYRTGLCNGALFWMYNDCWAEIGWSVIDSALRRKIGYYFVKRAFAPVRVILRRAGKRILMRVINDLPASVAGHLVFGYRAFDGSEDDTARMPLHLRRGSTADPVSLTPAAGHLKRGVYFAAFTADDGSVTDTGLFRAADFRDLAVPAARPRITGRKRTGDAVILTVRSDSFAHAVHFTGLGAGVPDDNYFDLLAGGEHRVRVTDCPAGVGVAAVNR